MAVVSRSQRNNRTMHWATEFGLRGLNAEDGGMRISKEEARAAEIEVISVVAEEENTDSITTMTGMGTTERIKPGVETMEDNTTTMITTVITINTMEETMTHGRTDTMNTKDMRDIMTASITMENTSETNMKHPSTLSIATWNIHCNFDIASEYLKSLASKAHIIAIQEHGLFPCELNKLKSVLTNYSGTGKASAQLKDEEIGRRQRIGGCGILWSKALEFKVIQHQKEGSDRICLIELKLDTCRVFIFCVYLPHQSCKIAEFATELSNLKCLLCKYRAKGVCVIIGDWNISFGKKYGSRCEGQSYPNVKIFMEAMDEYDMEVVDIGSKGNGETYTFMGGHGKSYIDHVAISSENGCQVINCTVLADSEENVSDHLPMVLQTSIQLGENERRVTESWNKRIAWHKIEKSEVEEKYTQPLESRSYEILLESDVDPNFITNLPEYCDMSPESIDTILQKLTTAMVNCGDCLQTNEFNRNIKPYWNENLGELSKRKDQKRAIWINEHGKNARDNKEYEEFRDCKKEFRKQKRIEVRNYEVNEMNELNKTGEIDVKYFWWLVNKNKIKMVSPIMSESGEILTNPKAIQKEWNEYYMRLYRESEEEEEYYDSEFRDFVLSEIPKIEIEMKEAAKGIYLKGGPITMEDMEKVIKSLPKGKACGYDKVSSEHVINSGPMARSIITWLMNGMIRTAEIPQQLKKGLIVSIPKPDKDSIIKGNNRGLTLLPTIYKIFEKIIMHREENWVQRTLSPIQSCGQQHVSCLHTSFLVQQAVTMNLNRGRTVHGLSLDTRKAFDALWILGMLYKLYIEKINPRLWLLVYDAYKNFMCTAYVSGIAGPWFVPERGVHQGAPLSMLWYCILINDLLKELCNYPNGLCVNNLMLSSPAHADDVIALTTYKTGINDMGQTAVRYSKKWRFSYNYDKTVYLCWGEDDHPEIMIKFGNETLLPEIESRHMGVTLITDQKLAPEICQRRAGKGRYPILAGLGIGGDNVRTSPSTLSKIYWAVSIPKMLYGLEVTPINDTCIKKLEDSHRENARLIQNLPTRTPIPAPVMMMGWQSIEAVIAYMKVMFLMRVLCLEPNSLYRKLLVIGIESYKLKGPQKILTPVCQMMKYVNQYGLNTKLETCKRAGTWKMVEPLKREIKGIIQKWDENRIRASCLLYRSLSTFSESVRYKKLNVWWKVVAANSAAFRSVSSVVALLCGTQPSGCGTNFGSRTCQICCDYTRDTVEHILFECAGLQNRRATLLKLLTDSMPYGMRESFAMLNTKDKAIFILSGLGKGCYIPEWQKTYLSASRLVHTMYSARKALYDSLERNY